jgi:2-methylaconitate cis-trans-isomerase PrpF
MGKVHPTLQLTGAVCLGAAVCIEGTVAHDLSVAKASTYLTPPRMPPKGSSKSGYLNSGEREINIRHGGGVIAAAVRLSRDDSDDVLVNEVTVSRTARRLFEGSVLFHL